MAGKLAASRKSKQRSPDDSDTRAYKQPSGSAGKDVDNQRLSRMPHERDESATATGNRLDETPVPSRKRIDHAIDDLKAGRKDTDRRGVPSDVPAPEVNSTNALRNRGR